MTSTDSLAALRRLSEYGELRRNIFQSETALQWFVRRHRAGLVAAGALTMLTGHWFADAEKFDAFVLQAGADAASRQAAG